MKATGTIQFKVCESIRSTKKPPKENDKVLKVFPFAENSPEWAYKALYDYFNLP
jgi:hypothetical protein